MFPHLAGDMSYDLVTVLEFDTKLSPRKGLSYNSAQLDNFLILGHTDITRIKYSKNDYVLQRVK